MTRLLAHLSRIRYRLLAVNLFLLLVPVAGLEFARLHERQLLSALEREMRSQAVLVRALLEADLAAGIPLEAPRHAALLERAAKRTRLRVRVLDADGLVRVDSHAGGPPEGPEPTPPALWPYSADARRISASIGSGDDTRMRAPEPPLRERVEVAAALAGQAGATTRVGPKAVYLFLSEPIRAPVAGPTESESETTSAGPVVGAVYVVRSTHPVLVELYRIRNGLLQVLGYAVALAVALSLALSWSIARPLARMARAARAIAAGERETALPVPSAGELRELGEALAHMRSQLDRRARHAADFAAEVAHEFKSPLTSIRGAAELLSDAAKDDPAARERFLRNIELDVDRLDRLVSRLLELGRLEASEEPATTFDLCDLLERLTERCATPDVAITLVYGRTRRFCRGRSLAIEAAVANLLDNAVRYSPAGQTVALEVSDAGDERVLIQVSDAGPGVPERLRARVFDRFFTTDEDRAGTGLGLAIVRSVAEQHRGRVQVDERPGGGARFRLWLAIGHG